VREPNPPRPWSRGVLFMFRGRGCGGVGRRGCEDSRRKCGGDSWWRQDAPTLGNKATIDSPRCWSLIEAASCESDLLHEEDLKLAKRVVTKDRGAAEVFFDNYFARLYRFVALRVDQPEACEDVVQEAMIKAIRNLHSYRGEAALFTWLCQIGRNEISNYFQKFGRKEAQLVSLDDDPHIRAALESLDFGEMDTDEKLALEQVVQLTLDYLPEKYSRALEWKYLEGLTVEEIADRIGSGVVAAQSLLARARSAFRRGFAEVRKEQGAMG
jgi:RNA polymerase sigma-70 factor (ECF subfamily)